MTWRLFRRGDGGSLQLVGVDDELLDAAPLARLPVACEVVIEAPSVLPDDIGGIEQAVERAVVSLRGCLAGTIRTGTRLWVLVYLPDGAGLDRFRSLEAPRDGTLAVDARVDPGWANFDRVRPRGMEDQSLADLRLVDRLFRAGDVGGSRPVEHSVDAIPAGRRDQLVMSLSSVGYVVEPGLGEESETSSITVRHDADPADITPDSWTIRQIAERLGATYAGWTCPVRTRPVTQRRRWFRRSVR